MFFGGILFLGHMVTLVTWFFFSEFFLGGHRVTWITLCVFVKLFYWVTETQNWVTYVTRATKGHRVTLVTWITLCFLVEFCFWVTGSRWSRGSRGFFFGNFFFGSQGHVDHVVCFW